MPLPNRVTPLGELMAAPARGLVYGNRGCLHDDAGRIRRGWAVKRWIACRLQYRGRRRGPLLQPGRFTELFFLDEATALAAGHRACAQCRHADHARLAAFWRARHGADAAGADAIDGRLHTERVDGRARRLHDVGLTALPDGAFVLWDGDPRLVLGDALLLWTPAGYADPVARPAHGRAAAITPPSLIALLGRDGSPSCRSCTPARTPPEASPGASPEQ